VNFENFGYTTKNNIFRQVKLLADLSTRLLFFAWRLTAFTEIHSQILVFRTEISKHVSQLLSYSTFDDGITPGAFALSSVSLDIGQPYWPFLTFRNFIKAMRSCPSFVLCLLRS